MYRPAGRPPYSSAPGEEAALQPSRQTLHRRSPRGATKPPNPHPLSHTSRHRDIESIEFAEIPRVPRLVGTRFGRAYPDGPEEENEGGLNGTARAPAGE